MLRVLYDGWSLIYEPLSPAALHLLAILENTPGEVQPVVALPGQPPPWFPATVDVHLHPVEQRLSTRLRWEQRILPRLVKSTGARLLHMTTANPALFALAPTVVSPAGYKSLDRQVGVILRARQALSVGGMARARGLFWPADLPKPQGLAPIFNLPPVVPSLIRTGAYPVSHQTSEWDLPETFILYHGPYGDTDLRRLILAWSWAAEPLGDDYPIYLLGIDEKAGQRLPKLMLEFSVTGTFISVPSISPMQLAKFYRECSLLFHPAEASPWGGAIRNALACGKPVVALETPLTDALVGKAAYLLPEEDPRAQGAALITVTGEQELSDQLSKAAQERSALWGTSSFGEELLEAYHKVLD